MKPVATSSEQCVFPGLAESPQIARGFERLLRPPVVRHGVSLLIVLAIGMLAAMRGLALREQLWERTAHVRYTGDIAQAFAHGDRVFRLAQGDGRVVPAPRDVPRRLQPASGLTAPTWRQFFTAYIASYQKIIAEQAGKAGAARSRWRWPAERAVARDADVDYGMDYPPLRLLTMALWVKHVRTAEPARTQWLGPRGKPVDESIARPLLAFNSLCTGIAAICVFILVWYCMWRGDARERAKIQDEIGPAQALIQARVPGDVMWWACAPAAGAIIWWITEYALRTQSWPERPLLVLLPVLFMAMVASARAWPAPYRYWACGLISALLVWFNAAIIIDTHAWPQWDIWLMPVFLVAVLAALADWWFVAGLVLALGVMAKGQMVAIAPLFVLWPVFEGRFGVALRAISGFLMGAGLVVSPWLLSTRPAAMWLGWLALAAGVGAPWVWFRGAGMRFSWLRNFARRLPILAGDVSSEPSTSKSTIPANESPQNWTVRWPAVFPVLGLLATIPLCWASIRSGDRIDRWMCAAITVILVVGPWVVGKRSIAVWLCLALGIGVFMVGHLHGGDWSWYTIGFEYGAQRYKGRMAQGEVANLPGVLMRFGWNEPTQPVTIPPLLSSRWPMTVPLLNAPVETTLRVLLGTVYAIGLVISAAGAAMHRRRGDPRLLFALSLPWLLFPLLMTQMSSRYYIWSATLSASFVAVSVGTSLLHLLITVAAALLVLHRLLGELGYRAEPDIYAFLSKFGAQLSWMMLLVGAIHLYLAMTRSRRAASIMSTNQG